MAHPSRLSSRLKTAATLDGKSARPDRLLGHLLARLGKLDEAAAAYRGALLKTPADATLHYALGAALAAGGHRREAKAAYRDALRVRPNFPEALLNLGNVHYDEGAFAAAAVCCRKALALRPTYAKAWCNLGNALQMLGGAREATGCYQRTLALDPKTVAAQHNLGNAWMARGDFTQAEACFRETLALDAERAEHYNSLGNALFQQRRNDEAEACYRKALEMDPGYAAVHTNLANVLMRQSSRAEMICHYERALELDPKSAGGHYNLALAYLRQGRYAKGWRAARVALGFSRTAAAAQALHGSAMARRNPVRRDNSCCTRSRAWAIRCSLSATLPLVAERGGNVVLAGAAASGAAAAGIAGRESRHRPRRTAPEFRLAVPADEPAAGIWHHGRYNSAEHSLYPSGRRGSAGCAGSDGRVPGLRVGLAWAGNPQYRSDEQRSMPLRALLPLADVPGISWFSLQMGPACRQMSGAKLPLIDASFASRDMAETAALVATLDLVITVDTSIAHLAGAMGVPLWVVLPQLADWRWMDARDDCPWYPQARLFRQPTAGDWAAAVERVRCALEKLASERIGGDEHAGAGRNDISAEAHVPAQLLCGEEARRWANQTTA